MSEESKLVERDIYYFLFDSEESYIGIVRYILKKNFKQLVTEKEINKKYN